MFRAMTKFWLVPALLLWGGYTVFGFSLAGPIGFGGDSYQQPVIGYGLGPPSFGVDVVAPKNLGEQYRWNVKNVYYTFDSSFLTYYGTNGAAQVDAAFAILNSLSNVDAYTPALSEWPLTSSRINYTAAQVGMIDLKSFVLVEMMEQLGLAEPDRWTFCLRDRDIPAGAICPNYIYNVIQRNFDPVTQNYSTYVNGVLYTFNIIETCTETPDPLLPLVSGTENVPVDPEQVADGLTAVAAGQFGGVPNPNNPNPSLLGKYYFGLTRDDIGGLRYLLSSNTIVTEQVVGAALQLPGTVPSIILTSNLAQLNSDALTNNQAALQALYPTLQITSSTPLGEGFVPVTNFVVVTNEPAPTSPAGTPPTITTNPVVTTVPIPTFAYTFGNVLTNFTYTNGGVLVTNSPSEYLLVPSNQCGFSIISNALTFVLTSTNTNGFTSSFTTHALVVNIFSCETNAISLLEGMEKINFFRVDYDSLVSQTWAPFTNTYTLTAVSNNRPFTQTYNRVVNRPDIVFSAQDLQSGPSTLAGTFQDKRTQPFFYVTVVITNGSPLGGPGTIGPGTNFGPNSTNIQIILDKTGPIFTVEAPSFEIPIGVGNTNIPDFQWASFDGTTNAPVVYPVNTDYQNLVNNIFLQIITPGSLPNGNFNVSYSVPLTVSGATPPPYTFTVTAGALPPGLSVVTVGQNYSIKGTPTATGIFDFSLSVTDTSSPPRTSYRNFAIEIDN
jgi:hypothetical protein